ncbi:tetratricopeptide repeat protein [Hyalangium versicolor]|uniref:tetratricopeptide repeat protein n=1 Tax=Hyalangium versicolor TaxID=2861190 RepID=UPI001CCF5A1F|nr:hypothetical protein [Hyalangium versicolor]
MGGVRNGKSELEPGASGPRQETLAVDAISAPPPRLVQGRVEQHLQEAFRLLREKQAPKAFGELVRATRSLPMTRRLAAALVTVSLRAGTEAAAITLLSSAVDKVEGLARRDVRRQLARVLRKVEQLPRAIEVLDALLAAVPDDHASRRVLQLLLERTGKWEALVFSLEREAQDAFQRGEYYRAARAASWRARIQAEQLRNLARAAESYGQAANYLEQMEDAVGAFTVRLDGLRVLHASGASEAVLTAAASVCMSAAARLGRDAQARQVLEELKLIPPRVEPGSSEPALAQSASSEARIPRNTATVEMSLPLLEAMLAAAASEQSLSVMPEPEAIAPAAPRVQVAPPPSPAPVQDASPQGVAFASPTPSAPPEKAASAPIAEPETAEAPPSDEAAAPESPVVASPPPPVEMAESSQPEAPPDEAAAPASPAVASSPPPVEMAESSQPEAPLVEAAAPESPAVASPPPPAEMAEPSQLEAPPEEAAAPSEPAFAIPSESPEEAAVEPSPEPVISAAPQAEAIAPFVAAPAESSPPPPLEDSDELAAPNDQEEGHELTGGEGAPLTELLEIPDETTAHSAHPVTSDELEEDAESEESAPEDEEEEDPLAEQRLEAQLIARKSWRELAQLYLTRADRAKEPLLRAEALSRLAELMENELSDPSGAARIYREIVSLTGDRDALKEQLRLLSQRGDPSLVRRALDEAVQSARTAKARAAAYLTRAERALEAGEKAQAKADFETAEALTPGMLLVLAGLVRCVPNAERPILANRLRSALSAAPRRSPDRAEALRVLASVAEDSLKDPKLAQWAWTEVLSEEPDDARARERLLELARVLRDRTALSHLLREQIAREPRGPTARLARIELVTTLEDSGDAEGVLTELRQAVRFEPGHKEAWLLLADRLTEHGQIGEAAWALDNAASAMEDEAERLRTWQRLASFCHNVLKDPARADMYSRRAENLRRSLEDKNSPPIPEAPRSSAPPRREGTGSRPQVLMPPPGNLDLTPSGQAFPPVADEPSTDIHEDVASRLPDHARPTIEFSAVTFPGDKMPFSDEEKTATEAPEGFVPPGSEPAPASPPPPAKATRSAARPEKAPKPAAAAPKKAASKKVDIAALDPSRELDSLLGGGEDEADHTSPSLSAWSLKRAVSPSKDGAAAPPAAPPEKQTLLEKPPVRKATARMSRVRPVFPDESPPPPPPPPEPEAPPARAKPPAEARQAAMKPPPPPREALSTSSVTLNARGTAAKGQRTPKGQESADSAFAKVSPPEAEVGRPAQISGSVQNTSIISWEAPPGKMEPVRRVARVKGAPGTAKAPSPEPPAAEPAVFKKVREYPLDAELYLQIADYFEGRQDGARALLMREIADALEGREGTQVLPPRQELSPDARSGLRHPLLRTPAGELLTFVGVALCRLFPMHGRAAGTKEPLRSNLGPGAPVSMEALKLTQRLLGIEAPEVVLSEDNGPPFSLVFTNTPRLLVGKQAVRQVLPAPELRFYAGRAIICLEPDLLALRSLKKDQVLRGIALLSTVLKDGKSDSLEARVVRESLTPEQLSRATDLFGAATRQFDVSALADAARDSANRAGLIACGAVGPALAALKMKRALEREVVELVRFAASERYFQLRSAS